MANTLIVLVLLAGGFGFRYLGQLDFETSFPFAIVTALSLGYGNSTMPTATSRVFLMVYFVMAACAFAAFFYGQHQMILESHEANLIKKIRDRRLRRERTLERFNSLAFQSTTANEPQVEERNPNSEGNDHAGSLLSFIAFIRVFGLYFGFLRPTASEQAAIEARAARTARKRRRWEKAREEIRRRRQQSRLAMSAGRIGAVGSALRMRLFGASAGREGVDGGGGSGEDSDVGDDVVASDAVVEVLARGQIDLEAGMGRLAGRNGSLIAQRCNPASTGAITMSAVLPRPRAPMRGMTEASGQSLGVTEGMMEDELARIIEKQRVRLFVLAVSALFSNYIPPKSWLVSAWVFQWTEPTWTYFDAFYFCFTTMATIGYSDLYPTTAYGWEVWFVFVMTSVGMYASLFGIVGEIWARKYDLAMVRHQARTHERRNRAKLGPGGEQSSERD
ncbi:hypothetical protein DFJ73DRAFT_760384 [Zopfochytrium polystomum]|nr:hypothetical protein DFJ73DRAFT_760384 [Zopfochytrium polystomum]